MEDLVSLLSFILVWLPFLFGCLFFLVYLIIYMIKASDYKDKYLNSLDEETRKLYFKIQLKARMPYSYVFKRKAVDHNEDK